MMTPAQLPELQDATSVEYVREMLQLELSQEEAANWFVDTIDSCVRDGVEFAKSFDDSMHILGQSSRKSVTRRLTSILQTSLMKRLPRVPVVAMTARAMDEDRELPFAGLHELGVFGHVHRQPGQFR